jgi:large conductance mechanosensitive channel
MKGFAGEFKEFISRGSVIDLAVGVIIGGAFTTIVKSLVDDIIMPFVGWIIGGRSFAAFKLTLPAISGHNSTATIAYGSFVQNTINFLLVALVIFLIVKAMNTLSRAKDKEDAEAAAVSEEVQLLTEIRDSLKK